MFHKYLDQTFEKLKNVKFNNCDFKRFFNTISYRESEPKKLKIEKNKIFIYCDPPYLRTRDTYSDSFNEDNSKELFDCLQETECKFAMSEFNHPFVINQAEARGLNIIYLKERRNLKNRKVEILITNYTKNQGLLF